MDCRIVIRSRVALGALFVAGPRQWPSQAGITASGKYLAFNWVVNMDVAIVLDLLSLIHINAFYFGRKFNVQLDSYPLPETRARAFDCGILSNFSMSSPFTMPNYGCPDRATASSPALGPRRTEQTQESENVSIRPMRRELACVLSLM